MRNKKIWMIISVIVVVILLGFQVDFDLGTFIFQATDRVWTRTLF